MMKYLIPTTCLAFWAFLIIGWTLGFDAYTTYSFVLEKAGPVPYQSPDLPLIDRHGEPFQLRTYQKGLNKRFIFVNFIYLNCEGACPVAIAKMHQIHHHVMDLVPTKLRFLSISFDPERDLPKHLNETWETHGAMAGWELSVLQKSRQTLSKELEAFGVWVSKDRLGQFSHTSFSFLLDPSGKVIDVFDSEEDTETVAGKLRKKIL